jgi:threonine dehydratase
MTAAATRSVARKRTPASIYRARSSVAGKDSNGVSYAAQRMGLPCIVCMSRLVSGETLELMV